MNKLTLRFCPLLLLVAPFLSPALQAQPVITNVLNAASYAVRGLPHSDIAQGSMFVVFGQDLAQGPLVVATVPLSTEVGFCSIRVSGGGVTADAILYYISAAQVAAILPSRIPEGDATIAVTNRLQPDNVKTSSPFRIRVVRSRFGIFTRNQAGSGPGAVQNYNSPTDQPVNALTAPARPGQIMVLWGTGLGPVSFDETQSPQVGDLDVAAEVMVGNKSARILYQGRSAQFPGIDQINFEVPADAPEGCHVPVAVRVGEVASNFASIAIASAGAVCSDATGFAAADMEKIRSTPNLRFGDVVLTKTTVIDLKSTLDDVQAVFYRYDQDTALKVNRLGREAGEAVESHLPFGACAVTSGRGDPTRAQGFPGGPSINLQGPLGAKQIAVGSNGAYAASLGGGDNGPEYLVPGLYTVDHQAGPTGAGAFRATLTLPAPIEWTNRDSFSEVWRSQDLTFTWSGGDSAKEYVQVGVHSYDTIGQVAAEITCTERASAGRFTIPSWLLSTLPVSSGTYPGTSLPAGIVDFRTYSIVEPARFQAQGIDVGYFGYELINFKFSAIK